MKLATKLCRNRFSSENLDEIRQYAGGVRYRLGIRSNNTSLASEISKLNQVQNGSQQHMEVLILGLLM